VRSKHTSRPQSYVIRRLADPAACERNFLPDEVVDMSFDGFGLYWEADAVAMTDRLPSIRNTFLSFAIPIRLFHSAALRVAG